MPLLCPLMLHINCEPIIIVSYLKHIKHTGNYIQQLPVSYHVTTSLTKGTGYHHRFHQLPSHELSLGCPSLVMDHLPQFPGCWCHHTQQLHNQHVFFIRGFNRVPSAKVRAAIKARCCVFRQASTLQHSNITQTMWTFHALQLSAQVQQRNPVTLLDRWKMWSLKWLMWTHVCSSQTKSSVSPAQMTALW